MWYEALYYVGSPKSRPNPEGSDTMIDLRLFTYPCQYFEGKKCKQTKNMSDDVSRERGQDLYHDNLDRDMCKQEFKHGKVPCKNFKEMK